MLNSATYAPLDMAQHPINANQPVQADAMPYVPQSAEVREHAAQQTDYLEAAFAAPSHDYAKQGPLSQQDIERAAWTAHELRQAEQAPWDLESDELYSGNNMLDDAIQDPPPTRNEIAHVRPSEAQETNTITEEMVRSWSADFQIQRNLDVAQALMSQGRRSAQTSNQQ